ncbi:MAG TPA: hypothetical protein VGE56_06745 [Rhodocyclaceae bacterium]|jgi:hypothetical protein
MLRGICISVCIGFLLVGCATNVPLQRDQVAAISRETTPTELDRILAKATLVSEFEFDTSKGRFNARNYNLQTGVQSSGTVVCSPACFYVPIYIPVLTQYVVIQRLPSRSLFAWGTLEELSKDPDDAVSSVMPVLKQRLAEEQEKKKQARSSATEAAR